MINPHRILAPKTVRETSMQVFWLSLPCRPSQLMLNQWLPSAEALTLNVRAGITAAGPLPIHTGFPSHGWIRIQLCEALYHGQDGKSKYFLTGKFSAASLPRASGRAVFRSLTGAALRAMPGERPYHGPKRAIRSATLPAQDVCSLLYNAFRDIPNCLAAEDLFPLQVRNASWTAWISMDRRGWTLCTGAPVLPARISSGRWVTQTRGPGDMTTARSMAFRSSRTLPGHE
jgi:hypothetical protein